MTQLYRARPSQLMGIEDAYAAWCVDEAIAEYTIRRRNKQRLRPPETTDNSALIAEMERRQAQTREAARPTKGCKPGVCGPVPGAPSADGVTGV